MVWIWISSVLYDIEVLYQYVNILLVPIQVVTIRSSLSMMFKHENVRRIHIM